MQIFSSSECWIVVVERDEEKIAREKVISRWYYNAKVNKFMSYLLTSNIKETFLCLTYVHQT